MVHRVQSLHEDGQSSSSSTDSLATISSHESENPLSSSDDSHDTWAAETPPSSDMEARVKSERGGKELHNIASIPVRIEKVKNRGKGSYMLRMDDDLRQLLSHSGMNGKRRAKFADVGLHLCPNPHTG